MVLLISIQVGQPRTYSNPEIANGKPWTTAFWKEPVPGPVLVTGTHLQGDGQADLRFHGGPDKAVLAYSGDHYPDWRTQLEIPEMTGGAFGENLTFSGISEETVCIGDLWIVGPVRLQVSQPRQPCWKMARRWQRVDLPKLAAQTGRTGWYFRVLQEGEIESGMAGQLAERRHPEWTIARANRALFDRDFPAAESWELADLPELAEAWRHDLVRRLPPRGTRELL